MSFVGGIDLVSELAFNGFNSLLALSRERCKPFGIERDGMSLGDGCAMFVLESYESAKQRGTTVYAEVKGYHILNETYHPTSPHPDGIYALSCMKSALEMAHLNIEDVDYINAHGTGTKINDSSEFKAINEFLSQSSGFLLGQFNQRSYGAYAWSSWKYGGIALHIEYEKQYNLWRWKGL